MQANDEPQQREPDQAAPTDPASAPPVVPRRDEPDAVGVASSDLVTAPPVGSRYGDPETVDAAPTDPASAPPVAPRQDEPDAVDAASSDLVVGSRHGDPDAVGVASSDLVTAPPVGSRYGESGTIGVASSDLVVGSRQGGPDAVDAASSDLVVGSRHGDPDAVEVASSELVAGSPVGSRYGEPGTIGVASSELVAGSPVGSRYGESETIGVASSDPVTAPLAVFRLPEYPSSPVTEPVRLPTARPDRDPLAVAIGNASLLSAGYLLLGRWWLALCTGLVTVGLVLTLALSAAAWLEFAMVGWWLALVAHGWFLAGGTLRPALPGTRAHRIVAAGLAVTVLATVGVLRWEADDIGDRVAAATAAGDCEPAVDALAERSVGNRIADAPLAEDGDELLHDCDLVDAAERELRTALSGNTAALASGYDLLGDVLRDHPDREPIVRTTLDGFLDDLPTADPCDTAMVTDWLAAKGRLLNRADEVVAKLAPTALVDCADRHMRLKNWPSARDRFRQLLDEFPDSEYTARATQGVTSATQQIELANVTRLLTSTGAGGLPEYCDNPAPYSAAPAYPLPGPNPALAYDSSGYLNQLPASWKAPDAAHTVVVICAGTVSHGTPVETCLYEGGIGPFGTSVTFHRVAVPIRVYELRTGRLLTDTVVEIGGASCPQVLYYESYLEDFGPPSETYVIASDADVQAAFWQLLYG